MLTTTQELKERLSNLKTWRIPNGAEGIAEEVLDRLYDTIDDEVEPEEVQYIIEDNIYSCIDDALIYCSDQWDLLQAYCTPDNADLDSAIDDFTQDLFNLISEIY